MDLRWASMGPRFDQRGWVDHRPALGVNPWRFNGAALRSARMDGRNGKGTDLLGCFNGAALRSARMALFVPDVGFTVDALQWGRASISADGPRPQATCRPRLKSSSASDSRI